MSLRALLYRRPTEPQAIEIVFDKAIYLVRLRRHRLARRYTLRIQAATREVVLTMPPRGSLKEAKAFAQRHGVDRDRRERRGAPVRRRRCAASGAPGRRLSQARSQARRRS